MRKVLVTAVVFAAMVTAESGPELGYFVNRDGSFGVTANVALPLKEWDKWGGTKYVKLGHSLDAVFGSKTESLPNHVYADLSGSLELIKAPAKFWSLCFALRGARVEATQDFRTIDFAIAGDASIHHSHLLVFMYRWLTGRDAPDGSSPASFTLGYAQLFALKDQDSLGLGWKNRVDPTLFLSVPLTDNLGLSLRGRAFNQPADAFNFDTWKWMVEPVVTYKWGDKWMHLKYEHGALPPLFQPVDNWSVGAGFAF